MDYKIRKVNGKTFTHYTQDLVGDILLNQYTHLEVYTTTVQMALGQLDKAEQVLRRYLIKPDEIKITYIVTDRKEVKLTHEKDPGSPGLEQQSN